jgi:hypothetical protein
MAKKGLKILSDISNKKGSVMVIALIVATVLVATSLSITAVSLSHSASSRGVVHAARSFYAAEGGVEMSLYKIAGHEPGFEIADLNEMPAGIRSSFSVEQRTNTLPEPGKGNGSSIDLVSGLVEEFTDLNLLEKGSVLTVDLASDKASNYYNPPNSTHAGITKVDVVIHPSSRDYDNNSLEIGMTRVNAIEIGGHYYPEDSTVSEGDFDFTFLETNSGEPRDLSTAIYKFHPNTPGNEKWSAGDSVYIDYDSNSIVSSGDMRINTAFVSGTCNDIYIPSLGHEVVEGSDCDAQMSLSLSNAVFYKAPNVTYDYGYDNLPIYNDAEVVTITLTAVDEFEQIHVRHSESVMKAEFDRTMTFGMDLSKLQVNDTHPRINIFSPIQDINYSISSVGSEPMFSLPDLTTRSFGYSNLYRQRLELKLRQVSAIPIFNYSIAF